MNKIKVFAGLVVIPVIFLIGLSAVTLAQDMTAPAPYAGMKNPFGWKDAAAIRAGKAVYLKSCFSCHGALGNEVPTTDFSLPETAAKMEAHPDYYFYVVSEGIKDTEMAGYKHTVSETQRWQALTYMHSLGAVAAPPPPPPPNGAAPNVTTNVTPPDGQVLPPPSGPVEPEELPPPPPVLKLNVPAKATAGEPLHISINLMQGNETIAEAPVTFFFKLQYYTNNPVLTTIGQAITDENGTAEITLTPKTTGFIPVTARYAPEGEKPIEVTSTVELTAERPEFYETEVGLEYKGFPPDITLFPKSAWESREPGIAPVTVFRIPGGLPFIPFAAYLGVVILVWSLYVVVMYQVFRVAPKATGKGLNLQLLPMAGMAVLAGVGLLMVLILVTGPYSGHVILP